MKKKTKIFILIGIFIILICVALAAKLIQNTTYANVELPQGVIKEAITVNGDKRTFLIYLPSKYKTTMLLPVVMIFHGTVADGRKIMNYTKYNISAEKYNFIAVYPEKSDFYDWDLKQAEKSKDVKFISQLIDYLTIKYKADKSRIYEAGYSSGADLSMLLACTLPNKIAAFAPVGGNMRKHFLPGCQFKKPVSLLMINGTSDMYDKWDGGGDRLSVKDSLKYWETRDKCSTSKQETVFPHIKGYDNSTTAKLIIKNNCPDKAEVSLLEIDGGGHTWPGAPTNPKIETFQGKTNYDINANDILFNFFSRHKLR